MKHVFALAIIGLVSGLIHPAKGQFSRQFDYLVIIKTEYGDIKVRLFDDTPNHQENFVKLVKQGFYDSTTFYRILRGYVVQGGDPHSKPEMDSLPEGYGGPGYELDAEILGKYKPKRGMLGAARQVDQVNPARKSSGSQFFIVHDEEYADVLEGAYTFFGEVVEGMDVLDKIANDIPVDRYGLAKNKTYLDFSVKKYRHGKFKRMMKRKYGIEIE